MFGRGAKKADEWTDDRIGVLVKGDSRAWAAFVNRFAGVIYSAVRRTAGGRPQEDVDDVFQDVFVRLSRHDFRLLRTFDASRASLATWLAVIARSASIDYLRRVRDGTRLDDVAPELLAVEPPSMERVSIPADLLTSRQQLIMTMLYDKDMDTAEIASLLNINQQTVRSTHHKALKKLRIFFGEDHQ